MSDKRTMTLNLSEAEMTALEDLCSKKDLSKTAVLRQAAPSVSNGGRGVSTKGTS